jgi:hypothetical protein
VTSAVRGWLLRVLSAGAGLGLMAYLVGDAGAARVARVLAEAGLWLPLILAFEVAQIACDVLALRDLLGSRAREIPAAAWVRSSAVAYAFMALVPAGRAAGEVARASVVAKHVGGRTAAAASAQLQAAYLFGIGAASLGSAVVVASTFGPRAALALLLAANAVVMWTVGAGVLAILWDGRLGKRLERLRRRLVGEVERRLSVAPEAKRAIPWRAALICCAGRAAQLIQFGVLLAAVGGAWSVRGAFIAHGIELVGATLGDAVPNQLGVVDGAYRAFAGALGFAEAPARALSIAFLMHAARLMLGAAGVLVALFTRPGSAHDAAGQSSVRADAHS